MGAAPQYLSMKSRKSLVMALRLSSQTRPPVKPVGMRQSKTNTKYEVIRSGSEPRGWKMEDQAQVETDGKCLSLEAALQQKWTEPHHIQLFLTPLFLSTPMTQGHRAA